MNKEKFSRPPFESVDPGWSEALVLICEKCCEKQSVELKELRKEVKETLREQGRKGELRVVSSSCLGICPKDKVTMGVVSRTGNSEVVLLLLPSRPTVAHVFGAINQVKEI